MSASFLSKVIKELKKLIYQGKKKISRHLSPTHWLTQVANESKQETNLYASKPQGSRLKQTLPLSCFTIWACTQYSFSCLLCAAHAGLKTALAYFTIIGRPWRSVPNEVVLRTKKISTTFETTSLLGYHVAISVWSQWKKSRLWVGLAQLR